MNKIVREHYPVENLPADLREGLAVGQKVRVTLEDEGSSDSVAAEAIEAILRNPRPMTLAEARARAGARQTTTEEAVERIRALRDEWGE